MDILTGIATIIAGLVCLVLVAWFVVMLIHLMVEFIPARLADLRCRLFHHHNG